MNLVLTIPFYYVRWVGFLISLVAFGLGFFSLLRPQRSIALNIWAMSKFNWRVSPIDEASEIRTTRRLGIYLILLGLTNWLLYFSCTVR